MRAMIIGADGYLGWPTTVDFLQQGFQVLAIDDRSKRVRETALGIRPLVPQP